MSKGKPTKTKLKPGDRVVTNAAYSKLFKGGAVHRGVILKTVPTVTGAWAVKLDRNERNPMHIHEKFLQREE